MLIKLTAAVERKRRPLVSKKTEVEIFENEMKTYSKLVFENLLGFEITSKVCG